MKHNLKNRPKEPDTIIGKANWYEEWFEGFEKELREKYMKLSKKRISDIGVWQKHHPRTKRSSQKQTRWTSDLLVEPKYWEKEREKW